MTTPLVNAPLLEVRDDAAASSSRPAPTRRPRWLAEPLLHFVALGALLFGLDHALRGPADDGHTIVIGADVDREAVETFRAARGRPPNSSELEALRRIWLDNEVLYREGLALQVDKGDPAIRERVIFKALSVVDSNVKLPTPDDALLRSWFESHRDKYDEPTRYDFEEAALTGDGSEAAVREFVKALNAGTPGDAQAGLRVFKARPRANLEESYGAGLSQALEAAGPGVWQALPTRSGWRAMRLNAIIAAKPAQFAPLRGVVLQDWKDAVGAEQRTTAVRALAKKYLVTYEERVEGSSN